MRSDEYVSIRSSLNTKDHLRSKAGVLTSVPESLAPKGVDPLLQFWTTHKTTPYFVDLSVLRFGETERPRAGGSWSGPFSGRPELTAEIAPAVYELFSHQTKQAAGSSIGALRALWRTLDQAEAAAPSAPRITTTLNLTNLHEQIARDSGMRNRYFNIILRIVNTTRVALGGKPLLWVAPDDKEPNRKLPPAWQTELARQTLKRRWFAVLDRWSTADRLRIHASLPIEERSSLPLSVEQERLQKNYVRFDATVAITGSLKPTGPEIYDGQHFSAFNKQGFSIPDMLKGTYPDADDVRTAFHYCLGITGWNPAVLTSLDANGEFIEPHPKDPGRYVMRGTKARSGGAEVVTGGYQFKSQGSPGVVIRTLIEQTQPLRQQLRNELEICERQLAQIDKGDPATEGDLNKLWKRAALLRRGVRSPWLYLIATSKEIQWLDDFNYARASVRDDSLPENGFLHSIIRQINSKQPADRRLAMITASDLRDAYAEIAYRVSGGSILAVMRLLGHRHAETTKRYLQNTLLQEQHRHLYSTFSNALWHQIVERKSVDPAVLAKISRDGSISVSEYSRLETYRGLMRSRIGVLCVNPKEPPQHIAPGFTKGGGKLCPSDRCLLCLENSIITPESHEGLCMRCAELRHLKSTMPMPVFTASSFATELENIELALLGFEATLTEARVTEWEGRIAKGEHRVIDFDGVQVPDPKRGG